MIKNKRLKANVGNTAVPVLCRQTKYRILILNQIFVCSTRVIETT